METVDWSSDGRFVAAGGDGGAVRVYEADTLQLVHVLAGHNREVLSMAWSPDGKTLYVALLNSSQVRTETMGRAVRQRSPLRRPGALLPRSQGARS